MIPVEAFSLSTAYQFLRFERGLLTIFGNMVYYGRRKDWGRGTVCLSPGELRLGED